MNWIQTGLPWLAIALTPTPSPSASATAATDSPSWLLLIAIASIPGLFNLLVAYKHLDKDCQFYPFFQPYRSLGFWIWIAINLALPAAVFWFLYSLSSQPPISPDLVTKAITVGLVFTALVNTYVDTGFFGVDLKSFYASLTGIAYGRIAASQNRKSTDFWNDFKKELTQGNQDLSDIFGYLEDYVTGDISLQPEEKQKYQTQLQQARSLTPREEQVKALKSLMLIRRRDLPVVLQRFGCSSSLLSQFSKRSP